MSNRLRFQGRRVALERMSLIAWFLRNGKRFNCNTLTTRFECSRKTIIRDIEFMRDRLRWDFEYVACVNSYLLNGKPPKPTL